MRKYDSYINSGIDWLREIPKQWDVKRIDGVSTIVRGNTGFKKDELLNEGDYVALQYGKIYQIEEVTNAFSYFVNSEFYKSSQIVNRGDTILISTSETIEDLGHSCFYNRAGLGLIGGEQILLKPNCKLMNEKYLYYFSKYFSGEIKKYATGLKVFRYNIDDLKNIFIPIFPKDEQTTIAKYLDAKTEAIDKKVSLLEKKIGAYKKLKKSLINQVVTRGLDKNVKLKDSGIDWIGQIPEHWKVRRLKDIGKAIIGLTYSPSDIVSEEKGILVLRSSNIQNNKLSLSDNVYVDKIPSKELLTRHGDILICSRNGSRALIGKNIRIDNSSVGLTFGAFMTIFRTKNNGFISYFFNSQLFDYQSGVFMTSTINQLTINTLSRLNLVLPPDKEQKAIASYLDTKTGTIDKIVTNIQAQITTLKALRKTLINDVVTGKIKVIND